MSVFFGYMTFYSIHLQLLPFQYPKGYKVWIPEGAVIAHATQVEGLWSRGKNRPRPSTIKISLEKMKQMTPAPTLVIWSDRTYREDQHAGVQYWLIRGNGPHFYSNDEIPRNFVEGDWNKITFSPAKNFGILWVCPKNNSHIPHIIFSAICTIIFAATVILPIYFTFFGKPPIPPGMENLKNE